MNTTGTNHKKPMRGIILAGGSGTRLYPITLTVCKQLLPVYDKPMVYYPLAVLMLAGIRDILIISTPQALPSFQSLLGDGSQLGIRLTYKEQPRPNGIAEAFILGEPFIEDHPVTLILGDNIFYGHGFVRMLKRSVASVQEEGMATVFGYYVPDPERYGVVEFDKDRNVLSIEEKPKKARSNYAVTGLYFYTNDVIDVAKTIKPSGRGELEITDVNNVFLQKGKLRVELLGRGFAWLDTGTQDSLLEASNYMEAIEKRQGLKISCIEEIAYRMGYINKAQLIEIAGRFKSCYGDYLHKIAEEE